MSYQLLQQTYAIKAPVEVPMVDNLGSSKMWKVRYIRASHLSGVSQLWGKEALAQVPRGETLETAKFLLCQFDDISLLPWAYGWHSISKADLEILRETGFGSDSSIDWSSTDVQPVSTQ